MTDQPRLSERLQAAAFAAFGPHDPTGTGLYDAVCDEMARLQALEAREERLTAALGWVKARIEWNARNEFEPHIFKEWRAYNAAAEDDGEWPVETAEEFEGVYSWIIRRLAESRQEGAER